MHTTVFNYYYLTTMRNESKEQGSWISDVKMRISNFKRQRDKQIRNNPDSIHDESTLQDIYAFDCEKLIASLEKAMKALDELAAQDSGEPGSTKRSDCMASIAKLALQKINSLLDS